MLPLFPVRSYASAWPLGLDTLWTVVNRGTADVAGPQLDVVNDTNSTAREFYDCYRGVRLPIVGEVSPLAANLFVGVPFIYAILRHHVGRGV